MSELLTIKRSTAEGLADKIRAKTGKAGKLTTEQMIDDLDNINGAEPLAEYSQQNPIVSRYMEEVTYDSSDYSTSRVADYYSVPTDYPQSHPIGHSVTFPVSGVLHFADEEAVGKYAVAAGEGQIMNCKPGEITHWWLTSDDCVKHGGTVKPTGQVRMITTPAINVRDLGGWACDGGTVKYGQLFRGGLLSAADRDVLVGQLGIKHELDLRGIGDEAAGGNGNITVSPLGQNVVYTAPNTAIYYTISGKVSEWRTILRAIFNAVANKEPLIFHCAAGSDRTGTVALIVEALLGVSQSDIDKDFELSSFAIMFTDSPADRRRNKAEWVALIHEIQALKKGNTFRDRVINWVGNTLSFSDDDINAFRRAVIDGNPETITVDRATYTNLADPTAEAGWVTGKALSISSSNLSTNAKACVVNYIPCVSGDIIRIKNMDVCWLDDLGAQEATAAVMEFYDENKARIGAIHAYKCCVATDRYNHYIEVGKTLDKYTGGGYWPPDTTLIRYVRFTGTLLDCVESDIVITVNEEIDS